MVHEIRAELSQSEQRSERARAVVWHCGQTATAAGSEPAADGAGEEEGDGLGEPLDGAVAAVEEVLVLRILHAIGGVRS